MTFEQIMVRHEKLGGAHALSELHVEHLIAVVKAYRALRAAEHGSVADMVPAVPNALSELRKLGEPV